MKAHGVARLDGIYMPERPQYLFGQKASQNLGPGTLPPAHNIRQSPFSCIATAYLSPFGLTWLKKTVVCKGKLKLPRQTVLAADELCKLKDERRGGTAREPTPEANTHANA